MLALCTGMPRSASTWSYRAACALLRRQGRLRSSDCGYVHEPAPMDERLPELLALAGEGDIVIKCHQPGPVTLDAIANGTIRNIFTHRDPRDATASILRIGFIDDVDVFLGILKSQLEAYLAYAEGPSLCISYEDAVAKNAVGLKKIAQFFGCSHSPEELESMSDALGMEQTRDRASQLTDEDLDQHFAHEPTTLLHKGHVTDGRTGTWRRELTPEQARRVEQELAPFFARYGYEV